MSRILLSVLMLAGCVRSARDGTLSNSPSFRARSAAVAATRGSRGKSAEISRELVTRLQAAGLTASALEESDSVLAGSAVGLEAARSPRLLDEIRRATGADTIVFLSLDADWSSLEISALDARTGDAVLRLVSRPRARAFSGPPEIADAAARALAPLSAVRRAPRATLPDEPPLGEIPLPGN